MATPKRRPQRPDQPHRLWIQVKVKLHSQPRVGQRKRLTQARVIEMLLHQNAQLKADKAQLEAENADLTYRLETALDENEQLKWSAVEDGNGNITSLADRMDWEERFPEQFN